MKHKVATYEQTKKGSSFFYPKRLVEDGIHTKTLDLENGLVFLFFNQLSNQLHLVVFYYLYILFIFSKLYQILFTYLNHKKSYDVRHSVRSGSNPRRRLHLHPPPPTHAHTILRGKNYPAAAE